MSGQTWGQQIVDLAASGTSYNTFTTAQSLLTTATATGASTGFITLPPGFARVGSVLEYDALLNIGSASGQTWTFSIQIGGATVWTSGAIPTVTTTVTALPAYLKAMLRVNAVGNGTLATLIGGGFIIGSGICPLGATPGAEFAAGMGFSPLSNTTLAAGGGFNSTVSNTLDFLVASGTSSANNTIQLMNLSVKSWGNTTP